MGHNILQWDIVVKSKGGPRPFKCVKAIPNGFNSFGMKNEFEGVSNVVINDLGMGRKLTSKKWGLRWK